MFMIAVALGVAGITAYIWCIRGFFSALIHMVCVFAAGAVAFGVWEPVSNLIADGMPTSGFFAPLGEMAWGLGLALPFALSLAIFRGIVDSLLPANAQCETVVDYIGGGVCGLVSGVISAGILVFSITLLRAESDFMQYQPVVFTNAGGRGSLERTSETMIPWVDRLTVALYSRLSLTTLRTPDPMAVWQPSLETFPGTMKTSFDNKSRTTMRPDAFKIIGWYTVGDPAHPQKFDQLMVDETSPTPQKATDLYGKPFGGGASAPETDDEADHTQGYLAGFIVKFNSKAREKTGQVVIGNGQVRLVAQNTELDDSTMAIHPIAVVTNIDDPTKKAFAHFRINADNTYTSSVGGQADATMAFEFPIPRGYKPMAIYIKGARVDLTDMAGGTPNVFPDPSARDEAIKAGAMQAMEDIGPILDENGKQVQATTGGSIPMPLISVSTSMGIVLQKGGQEGSLDLQPETRGWSVSNGEHTIAKKALTGQGMDFHLKIDRFAVTEDRAVVKVDVTPAHRDVEFRKAYEALDRNAAPVLIDTNGNRYPAVGYLYKDNTLVKLRYTQGSPIEHMADLPAITQSSTDRELTIVFVVSNGVTINEFKVGDVTMPSDLAKKPVKAERGRSN